MTSLPEDAARALAFAGLGRLLSQKSLERLRRDLSQAGCNRVAAVEWVSASLFLALLAAVLAAFAALAASGDALVAVAAFFLVFAIVFGMAFNWPRLAAAKRAEEIERDLAIALRSIAIELAAGASFESALHRSAAGGVGGSGSELSGEFSRVLREAERSGTALALTAAGNRVASPLASRAFAQLRFAFEHGKTSGDALRKLADELVSVQKTRAREFAAKQAFFGMLFVSVACIVPALFAAYVIVGGAFLELSFGATEVLLAFCVLFPLVDAALLAFLRWKTPKLLST
jgi:pilus assembly protein TadC